jgi:hypothetical protein
MGRRTEMMVSISRGRIDRRLMTSHLMPSLARDSATSRQFPTDLEWATRVMSEPSRSILALPMGRRN